MSRKTNEPELPFFSNPPDPVSPPPAPPAEGPGMRNLAPRRPLAFLDLETTGTSPERDRVVEIAVMIIRPEGGRDGLTRRVNPGVPIPPDASAVHGIRDADVAGCPSFRDIAPDLARALEGADLAGFNILGYDLPLLEAEFQRAGIPFRREGRAVVDAQRIFHSREPRTLSAAVRFYTGQEHAGAHGAAADVAATIDVLDAQLERYPDLPRDVEGLDRASRPDAWVDSQGKIVWAGGEAALGFGKHRGRPLRDLAAQEPGYLDWILESDFPSDTKRIVREAKAGRFPVPDPD